MRKGKKVYDQDKGLLSPIMITKLFGIKAQKIYYFLRKGKIPYVKNKSAYVIKKEDIINNQHIFYKGNNLGI